MSKVDSFSNSVNYKVISFNEEQSLDSDSLKNVIEYQTKDALAVDMTIPSFSLLNRLIKVLIS